MTDRSADLATVRAAFGAIEAEGIVGFARHFSPAIEWKADESVPEAGTYRGAEAVTSYLGQLADSFSHLRFEVAQIQPLVAERLLVDTVLHGIGEASGATTVRTWSFVMTVRDETILRIESYIDRDQAVAVAAAGPEPGHQ